MKCSYCSIEFKTYKKNQKFCSMKCFGSNKSTLISKTCICGKLFLIAKLKVSNGKGKYCSKKCSYENMSRPSGLKYIKHKQNPTSFKKGQQPWNKELTYKNGPNLSIKGKHFSPSTEFKKGENLGPKNSKWKGDQVGYFGLHSWVQRQLGKAKICSYCNSKEKVGWANKSYLYKRDFTDWLALCHKCHMARDSKHGWGKAREKYPEMANL